MGILKISTFNYAVQKIAPSANDKECGYTNLRLFKLLSVVLKGIKPVCYKLRNA